MGLDYCYDDKYNSCQFWRQGSNPKNSTLCTISDMRQGIMYSGSCPLPPHPVVCLSSEFKNCCLFFFFTLVGYMSLCGHIKSSRIISPPTHHHPLFHRRVKDACFHWWPRFLLLSRPPTMHCADGAWSLSPGRLFVQHEKGGFGLRSLPIVHSPIGPNEPGSLACTADNTAHTQSLPKEATKT